MQRDPSPTPHIGHNLRQRVAWLPLFPQLPRGPCPHPSLPQTLYLTRDKWLPQLGSLTLLWVAFVAGGGGMPAAVRVSVPPNLAQVLPCARGSGL